MFKLTNLDSVIRAHNHFLAQNERLVVEASERAAKHAVEHVQKFPGFKPRTGKLQKRTRARAIKTRGGRTIKLVNTLPYAKAIDTGARPHVIKPRKSKFLSFRTLLGKWVRAKQVNHPGNKPYKFGWRAIHSAHRVLGQDLERQMARLAKGF